MKVSELGEFGLIDRLREAVGEAPEGETWVGDDAAVLRAPAGTILFTADVLVSGVHFDTTLSSAADLGYKSIAVNASDVAAMGGTPRRALVSLGITPNSDAEWIEHLYSGMRECCDEFDMAVVGGDISRSDCLFISVALIGNPAGRRVIHRSGARVGDVICVTGTLGASAAGYRLLRAGRREPDAFVRAHLRPTPRVREVQILRKHLPSAMIDVSDGFAVDLAHLCRASSVGAILEESDLPVADLSRLDLDRDPLDLALSGGEDYELCFTIPADRVEAAAAETQDATGTAVTVVGRIVEAEQGMIISGPSGSRELKAQGWDHLRS